MIPFMRFPIASGKLYLCISGNTVSIKPLRRTILYAGYSVLSFYLSLSSNGPIRSLNESMSSVGTQTDFNLAVSGIEQHDVVPRKESNPAAIIPVS